MSIEDVTNQTVDLLRRELLGPMNGPSERLTHRPDRTYLVGTLFPGTAQQEVTPDDVDPARESGVDRSMTIGLERSNEWMPSSMGLSFIHNGDSGARSNSVSIAGWETAESGNGSARPRDRTRSRFPRTIEARSTSNPVCNCGRSGGIPARVTW